MILTGACSQIASDERLIYVEPAIKPDTTAIDTTSTDSVVTVPRRILIEDHTGQNCPNCPDATNIIHELQLAYGDRIVPVAIHSEQQGIMEPDGLGTELGNTYYRHWNIGFKPAGLISRLDGGDGCVLDKTVWIYAAQYALELPTPIDIRLKTELTGSQPQNIDIDVEVICTEQEAQVAGKLQVWVTENGIEARQDSMGVIKPNYKHNHVLRAAANGTWGEELTLKGYADRRQFHYSVPVGSLWNPRKLEIVAFVYNDDEVMQCATANVTDNK